MADSNRVPNARKPGDPGPVPDAAPSTPRWVIALGILAVILIAAVAAQLLLGLQHGPAIHGS